MPIRKTPPHRVGITEVAGRVHVKPPLSEDDRDALRARFASLARGPLALELEQLKERIGARLKALGFPPALGQYEIHGSDDIEPGAPGGWQAAPPTDADGREPAGDAAPPATARHPALLTRHKGTVPWFLATALLRVADVQAHLAGRRGADLEGLCRASYWLGDLLRHASFKLAAEDLVLRAERDEEARRRGGLESGRERRAAREEDKHGWRVEAKKMWKLDPKANVSEVARCVLEQVERERRAGEERWVPSSTRTIEDAIRNLRPHGPRRRRAGSLEAK